MHLHKTFEQRWPVCVKNTNTPFDKQLLVLQENNIEYGGKGMSKIKSDAMWFVMHTGPNGKESTTTPKAIRLSE